MSDTIGHSRPVRILLAEDSEPDIRLTQEALREGKVSNNLMIARDGEETMQMLTSGGPLPDLILLDLNMPKKDGREVLKEIKDDPELRKIPVVVLTTSSADEDILRSYSLHANCYVTKPVDFDQFIAAVRSIEDFWLTVVRLPASIPAP